jgi:hypothetical protein
MTIEYIPVNDSTGEIDTKNEHGDLNNLNQGWSVKPFITGEDRAHSKLEYAIPLTKNNINQLEYQSKGKWKWNDSNPMEMGKKSSGQTESNSEPKSNAPVNIKSKSGIYPEKTVINRTTKERRYHYKGLWYTEQEFKKL